MSSIKVGLTTSDILKSIKRRAIVPDNQNTFSEQDFIDLMNEEMMISLVPSVLQTKEAYFLYKEITPIIANKSNYPIPERALANKLREVCFIDNLTNSSGNEYEMTQISVDDRYSTSVNGADSTGLKRFYLLGSDIVLHPGVGPSAYGGLAFYYYLRPNNMVKNSEVATIININRTTGDITLDIVPSKYGIASPINNQPIRYDFIKAKSPHNIIKIDVTINSLNTVTKTVKLDLTQIPDDLEVGDYFALAGQTCIPNIPTELHSILAQRVAQRILEALGDSEGLNNATAKIREMEDKMSNMLTNRVEGAPRKVVNRSLMTGVSRNRRR